MSQKSQKKESQFSTVVASITVLIHVYNYFTCLFFIGIEGYPEGLWFFIEIITEVFMVFEFIMQMLLRVHC